MNKALLVVNPHSGKKNAERDALQITQRLAADSVHCEVFISRDISALEQFIKNCDFSSYTFAGLVGGDGTMHAFINAVLKQQETVPLPLALFPCGTGNAFNLDIGCNSLEDTLSAISRGKTSFIDIAQVNFEHEVLWSFNILGCGLVADINQLAEKMRWLGASRYTIASLIKLISNPSAYLQIRSEHETLEGKFSFVLACNTRYTGKGMMMAPLAKLNDGKFDVIVVKHCSMFKLLRLFPKIFEGKHLGADVLQYIQTSQLSVTCHDRPGHTNIDGEMKGTLPFSFRVHPDKVRVFMK